ncbi:MAG: NAD(P)-dependent oxidoreductase [Cytophagales bacterium]|nr:NAD(P)-dependent oxidoreductase [Cytophagales bacterium]
MEKILITGGLGNLGSWLTEYIANQGYEVWILTKNFRKIITKVKYHLINCDLADFADIKEKLKGLSFDYVVHAGSVNDSFVTGYFKLAIDVNTLGTRNMLEYLAPLKVKHFIYLSTFQVYGKYEGDIDEDTPTTPVNDYGSTHLFAEYFVKQFAYTHKLPYSIIRLTNSYGCPKDMNTSKWYLVLNDLAKSAFENKEIILKSNGKALRDFIWMGDVCKVFHQLLQNTPANDTYNLASETTYTMLDIAHIVKETYLEKYKKDIPIKVNEKDITEYPQHLHVHAQKLKSIVQYHHTVSFKEEASKIFDLLGKKK